MTANLPMQLLNACRFTSNAFQTESGKAKRERPRAAAFVQGRTTGVITGKEIRLTTDGVPLVWVDADMAS